MTISIHALLAESDHSAGCNCRNARPDFYPRSPCGERPTKSGPGANSRTISIHALLAESDTLLLCPFLYLLKFLSTLSLRRATAVIRRAVWAYYISIHALLAESDKPAEHHANSQQEFLSTLSLRRATKQMLLIRFSLGTFLSTLSLRRATPATSRNNKNNMISIHALLAESDRSRKIYHLLPTRFLSTLSLRRATHYDNYNLHCVEISIHALLAESDFFWCCLGTRVSDFYPRSPCGERLSAVFLLLAAGVFLSTLSLRRATRLKTP